MKSPSGKAALGADKWRRTSVHDGYIAGNGKIYVVGGLGWTLTQGGFPRLTQRSVSLTALARVVGPVYGHANLGSGWEVRPRIDGRPLDWQSEKLILPTQALPAWGVSSRREGLLLELTDIVIPDMPILLRRLRLTRPPGFATAEISLEIPVAADSCNAGKDTNSIPWDHLVEADTQRKCVLLRGAKRRLFPDPYSLDFETIYYHRLLVTGASIENRGATSAVTEDGLMLNIGKMKGGQTVQAAIWIVTSLDAGKAKKTLADFQKKRIADVCKASIRKEPFTVNRTDNKDSFMLTAINNSVGLCQASQSQCGGVLASPYTYPVNYVRDQQGSFRLFLAAGEYERAYRALLFHAAMQNKFGIQNAFDAVDEELAPDRFDPKMSRKDAHWKVAEVPSYVILFARDYYQATGDLERVKPLYKRLAYNLRVQVDAFSENDLLPSPGDESYTQAVNIGHQKEFLDSNLLFIGAAEFMVTLAGLVGKTDDAAQFRELYDRVRAAIMKHLWMPEENRFACSTVDSRPVLDALLRCFWIETQNPTGPVAQGCLSAVLRTLVNPIRIVPDRNICAGMDPGYLLYAMARCQHPQVHQAAELALKYASRNGTYSEYYLNSDIESDSPFAFQRTEGTLRPWESGTCATALLQYLLGLRIDAPQHKIFLQPHLPEGWPGWTTGEFKIPGAGTLKFQLERKGKEIQFTVTRKGPGHALTIEVEVGAFAPKLISQSPELHPVTKRPDLLRATIESPAAKTNRTTTRHQLRFAW